MQHPQAAASIYRMKKYSIIMPDELRVPLQNWAAEQNRGDGVSISAAVRMLLREGLTRKGLLPKPDNG